MCLLQVVDISLLILSPLLFEDVDILMGFTFVWAAQQEIGFPRTLGIRHHDFRRDHRLHDDPLYYAAVLTP